MKNPNNQNVRKPQTTNPSDKATETVKSAAGATVPQTPKQQPSVATQAADMPFRVYQLSEVDEVFADNPLESGLFYLGDVLKYSDREVIGAKPEGKPCGDSAHPPLHTPLVSHEDAQRAFNYGFISALHVCYIFDDVLFLRGQAQFKRIKEIVETRKRLPLIAEKLGLQEDLYCYLLEANKSIRMPATHLKNDFLTGYQVALICFNRYDYSIFMQGHILHTEVLSSILIRRKKEEDARRGAARVVMRQYTLHDKDAFRGLCLENACLNDNGEPVRVNTFQGICFDKACLDDNGNPVPKD